MDEIFLGMGSDRPRDSWEKRSFKLCGEEGRSFGEKYGFRIMISGYPLSGCG